MKKYEYKIENLDCPNCANKIQKALENHEGLKDVVLNFSTLKLLYKTDTLKKEEVQSIINKIEADVKIIDITEDKKESSIKKQILRLVIGIIVAAIGFLLPTNEIIKSIFIILGYLILLYRTIKKAVKLFRQSKTINENFLVSISCIGAYLIGKHLEGLMVIILYEIGKILEEKAVNKTRKSISDLMNIKPEYANLKLGNEIKVIVPNEVKVGDVLLVKQGEKVPLDGIIVKGKASLDVSSLTGESKLRDVKEKDDVLSGSIVALGTFEIEVTEVYEKSTVNKILELVEHATDKKAKTETFVNKAAKIYTPAVFILAILIAIILPLFTNIQYTGESGSIYRALIFLVISCPCAIAISVPLSYFSGIGKASKHGILIKGSNYLDILKDIKEIVFDKTGTLTTGQFQIDKVVSLDSNFPEEKILEYAIIGESFSNHPIAKSIIKGKKIPKINITNFKEIAGEGISYSLNDDCIFIGNNKTNEIKEDENTKINVSINDKVIGTIYLIDKIKEGAGNAILELKKGGIITKMYTGDNKSIALKIGKELKLDEVKYEMLPNDKYKELEKTINNSNHKVAFVGDGINDSPVLALADVGISMGGVGSSAAIEASDIVIMTDTLDKIKDGISISKFTNKVILQNLIFAIGTKVLVLVLSTLGFAKMWQAVFADVGVTLLTILNTLRILKIKL